MINENELSFNNLFDEDELIVLIDKEDKYIGSYFKKDLEQYNDMLSSMDFEICEELLKNDSTIVSTIRLPIFFEEFYRRTINLQK